MAPLLKKIKKYSKTFETKLCVTIKREEMLDQVLNFFVIVPDYNLDEIKTHQNLYGLTSEIIVGIQPILKYFAPHYVFMEKHLLRWQQV